jgi:3-hydroxyisobutyrate dehydrogenase
MKIGFLGTGLMGVPLAQRLIEAGNSLMIYNRSTSKLATFCSEQITPQPTTAITHGDYIFLMLTDASAIEAVPIRVCWLVKQ